MMRRLALIGLLAAAGCGGGAAEKTQVRAANAPLNQDAVREYVAGARLMALPGVANRGRAKAKFEHALTLDPNLWEAHYNLGVIARQEGELREAVQDFRRALRIREAKQPVLALAEAYHALGDLKEASDALETYVGKHPDDLDARASLAMVDRERRNYDDALTQAREVLTRDSGNVNALLEVGRVYRAKQQYDVAELVFKKALAIQPDNAAIRNDLGLLALARGDTQAAFHEFAEATEKDPKFTPAHANQGSVLMLSGDYEGAAREYRAVLSVDPNDVDAKVALGAALRGQGKHQEARRAYEDVLSASPNHPAALWNLAVLLAEFLDKRPEAREVFVRYLAVAPTDAPERAKAEEYLKDIPAPAAAPTPKKGGTR